MTETRRAYYTTESPASPGPPPPPPIPPQPATTMGVEQRLSQQQAIQQQELQQQQQQQRQSQQQMQAELDPYYGHLSPLRYRYLYSRKELDDIIYSPFPSFDPGLVREDLLPEPDVDRILTAQLPNYLPYVLDASGNYVPNENYDPNYSNYTSTQYSRNNGSPGGGGYYVTSDGTVVASPPSAQRNSSSLRRQETVPVEVQSPSRPPPPSQSVYTSPPRPGDPPSVYGDSLADSSTYDPAAKPAPYE